MWVKIPNRLHEFVNTKTFVRMYLSCHGSTPVNFWRVHGVTNIGTDIVIAEFQGSSISDRGKSDIEGKNLAISFINSVMESNP